MNKGVFCDTKSVKNHGIIRDCAHYFTDVKLLDTIYYRDDDSVFVWKANGITHNGKNIDFIVKRVLTPKDKELVNLFKESKFNVFFSNIGIAPNIYDFFYIKNIDKSYSYYFLMEYVDMDLRDYLELTASVEDKKLAVDESINLIYDLVFNYGYVCADIKPANIMVKLDTNKKFERVYLIDFGADYIFKTRSALRDYSMLLFQLYLTINRNYKEDVKYKAFLFFQKNSLNKDNQLKKAIVEKILNSDDFPIIHYSKSLNKNFMEELGIFLEKPSSLNYGKKSNRKLKRKSRNKNKSKTAKKLKLKINFT